MFLKYIYVGASPIEQFAIDDKTELNFPYWHTMSRWQSYKNNLIYVGKFNDVLDFALDLNSELQNEEIAKAVGAKGYRRFFFFFKNIYCRYIYVCFCFSI